MDRYYASPPAETGGHYLRRHWRGELSLTRTFWLDCVLLNLLCAFMLTALCLVLAGEPLDALLAACVLLAIIVLVPALWAWQLVGLWRCARRHGQFTGVVVPLLILAGLAQTAYVVKTDVYPAFISSFHQAYDASSVPPGHYIDAQLTKLRQPGQLDSYLRNIPLYYLIHRVDPDEYQAIVGEATRSLEQASSFSEFDELTKQTASDRSVALALDAPASTQTTFWQAMLEITQTLQQDSPHDCAGLLADQLEVDKRLLDRLPADSVARLQQGFEEMVGAALRTPASTPPGATALADLDDILGRLQEHRPNAYDYFSNPKQHLDDADGVCQVHVEFYRQVLALPAPRAGEALRLLPTYAQGG